MESIVNMTKSYIAFISQRIDAEKVKEAISDQNTWKDSLLRGGFAGLLFSVFKAGYTLRWDHYLRNIRKHTESDHEVLRGIDSVVLPANTGRFGELTPEDEIISSDLGFIVES